MEKVGPCWYADGNVRERDELGPVLKNLQIPLQSRVATPPSPIEPESNGCQVTNPLFRPHWHFPWHACVQPAISLAWTQNVVQDELEKMIEVGVIVSHSDWNSPIMLGPKPDSLHGFWQSECSLKIWCLSNAWHWEEWLSPPHLITPVCQFYVLACWSTSYISISNAPHALAPLHIWHYLFRWYHNIW